MAWAGAGLAGRRPLRRFVVAGRVAAFSRAGLLEPASVKTSFLIEIQ